MRVLRDGIFRIGDLGSIEELTVGGFLGASLQLAIQIPVLAVVDLSDRLSHASVVSKQRKLWSRNPKIGKGSRALNESG